MSGIKLEAGLPQVNSEFRFIRTAARECRSKIRKGDECPCLNQSIKELPPTGHFCVPTVPSKRVISTGFFEVFWIFLKNEHGKA